MSECWVKVQMDQARILEGGVSWKVWVTDAPLLQALGFTQVTHHPSTLGCPTAQESLCKAELTTRQHTTRQLGARLHGDLGGMSAL